MLIDEIVVLLSTESSSLTAALLKTKVLLRTIGEKDLATWISKELGGYSEADEVPPYRKLRIAIQGTITNGFWVHKNASLPVLHLDEKTRDALCVKNMGHSIAALEELAKQDGTISGRIEPEFYQLFDKALDGWFVQGARTVLSSASISGLLINVRSRLLDFLLELRERIEGVSTDVELKSISNQIDTKGLFVNSMFGDNTTIVVGDRNRTTTRNSVVKNDLAGLLEVLAAAAVPSDQLASLETAIAKDREGDGPSLSGATGTWYSRLLARAAQGAYVLGVDAVSTTVFEHLKSFLGL